MLNAGCPGSFNAAFRTRRLAINPSRLCSFEDDAMASIIEVVVVVGNELMKGFPMDSMIVVWIGFK